MNNKVHEYLGDLNCILSKIELDFKNLDGLNFECELKKFGYELTILEVDKSKYENIEEQVEHLKTHTGVYVFKESEDNEKKLNESDWKDFKEKMKKNKIPQWRRSNENKILYVGKSNNMGKRIIEHTTKASKSTYALKLNCFKKCFNPDLKYNVYMFYLKNKSDHKKNAINELVESILHTRLEPSIGAKSFSK